MGINPLGIAFDGANMWIANRNAGTVTKLRASDGTVIGTFSAPGGPYGVAFDGHYIWLSEDPDLQVLRASDGSTVFTVLNVSGTGIAFDGANIWMAEFLANALQKF